MRLCKLKNVRNLVKILGGTDTIDKLVQTIKSSMFNTSESELILDKMDDYKA